MTTVRSAASSRPGRPREGPQSKTAAKVAGKIVEDVIALGWPVGQILGSEAELLERYKVSRAVFREAVRLVEHQQVARTRRGPGGGVVITEPTVDAVIDAVLLYLYRIEAKLDEVFEARIVLEEIAVEWSAARLQDGDRARLSAFAQDAQSQLRPDPRALHALIAEISRNPALELFVAVLNRVTMLYSTGWQDFGPALRGQTAHAHARIAEAVLAGDSALARHRMRRHLEAEADYLRKRRSTRQLLPDRAVALSQSSNGKLAEAVTRRITRAIVAGRLQPGQLVGTEPELIEREGVSRAVFREAVRLLEHHQIARMRRGPGGGLFVFEPSAAAVIDVAAIYLARKQMRLADLAEIRTGVEVAIAGLAAANVGASGMIVIRQALDREAEAPPEQQAAVMHDLHAALAAAAGSRVLAMIALVLIRLCQIYRIERLAPGSRSQLRSEVMRAHERIAAAVEAGDGDLARRRMGRHLEALSAVMH